MNPMLEKGQRRVVEKLKSKGNFCAGTRGVEGGEDGRCGHRILMAKIAGQSKEKPGPFRARALKLSAKYAN